MAEISEVQKKWVDGMLSVMGGSRDTASPDTPGLGGVDTGQVRADVAKEVADGIKETAKAIKNWVNAQGVTTIFIENYTSKVLKKKDQDRDFKDQAKWDNMGTSRIAAAQDEKTPGKATITVLTDKTWRGKTTANTSGWVTYEIDGEAKPMVKFAWKRKGDGQMDKSGWGAESGRYEVLGDQSKVGEFTFSIWEEKPKAAKPPAAPSDTYVLFEYNDFELTSKARSQLHDFAVAYLAAKSKAEIKVEGWASIDGKEGTNEKLSYNRAESVFNFLIDKDKGGLSKDHVKWDGKKSTSDFDGDKKKLEPNRRVTIQLK